MIAPKAIKRYLHQDRKIEEEFQELFSHLGFGIPLPYHKAGNFSGIFVNFTLPTTANQKLTVPHKLGRKPYLCLQIAIKGSSFVPLDIDWDEVNLYVSSSSTGKEVWLIVF